MLLGPSNNPIEKDRNMNDALIIIAFAVCFFLFAGDPDFHDLIMKKLQQEECVFQQPKEQTNDN